MDEFAKMRAASKVFKLLYMKTLQKGKAPQVAALADLLCMKIPGTAWIEVYNWFEGLPLLRRWVGSRIARKLREESFEVKLEPWESTINVMRDNIMFDQLGGYMPTIRQMAIEVKLLPWRQSVKLIEDGFAGTAFGNCFDGYPLFSASHSTGTNVGTKVFSSTALSEAVLAMRSQVDPDTGDDLLIEPTHVWYHKDLEDKVGDVLDKEFVIDKTGMTTESNKWKDKLVKVPLRGLTSSASKFWGLLALEEGNEQKPILHRYMPGSEKFVALDKDDDDANFDRRELKYGVEYWSKTVPGFPQFVWGSDGTT